MCVNGLLYILTMYKNHREHYLMFGNGLMLKETSLRVLFKKMMNPLSLHLLDKFYHVTFMSRVHFFRHVNGGFYPYFPISYSSCLIVLHLLRSETALY